ncbi:hypothetical protein C8J46_10924 [Sphingomonas sp. PP-F2F-A104-K0414]|uniref:CHAT domain-containing protein n=1 Tax=Sphingomonas sp. PP-F2F-A104-K0414 TaxID=2135661 RepID=UPI001051C3D0|nr:CHAT domain-containing protein [Sphingomonas sp. PP-F2F-A104-K0414]TCP96329.1 hypothetical protein C8J46_10924 [Sphingomonas sp. PP-F2F-A104-K0414]
MSINPILGSIDPRLFYAAVAPPPSGQASLIQGYSRERLELYWVYRVMARLPATLVDPAMSFEAIRGHRACGQTGWRYSFLYPKGLLKAAPGGRAPFWIVFTASPDAAAFVSKWQSHQRYRPIHASLVEVDGAIRPEELTADVIRSHCLRVVAEHEEELGHLRPLFDHWKIKEPEPVAFPFRGHFIASSNQLSLSANGRRSPECIPHWSGESEEAYEDVVHEGFAAVLDARTSSDIPSGIALAPPRPVIWLIAPSWLPNLRTRLLEKAQTKEDKSAISDLASLIENQREFSTLIGADRFERITNSKIAQALRSDWHRELLLFSEAIGWATAGTMAGSWRLRPSINRVIGRVRQFSENLRSTDDPAPAKVAKLFADMQTALCAAVDPRAVEEILNTGWGVKVISDAPVEWLPIGDLPLCLECDVSRTTATPADALLLQLEHHEQLRLSVADFSEILLVSAFAEGARDDRIVEMLKDHPSSSWTQVRVERVQSEDELIAAINGYDGPLLIFDCHGSHPVGGKAHLVVGHDQVTIASLAARIRMPPIVVLSACDTQAAARSTDTVAKAMLELGARTVLGTSLPVHFLHAGLLVSRLIRTIDLYLPIAAQTMNHVPRWSEFIGGLLRSQFFFEVMMHIEHAGLIDNQRCLEILGTATPLARESGSAALDHMEKRLAEAGVLEPTDFRAIVRRVVPLSDMIRYVQLGNPETITIGSLEQLPEELQQGGDDRKDRLAPKWRWDAYRDAGRPDMMQIRGLRSYGPFED